MRSLVVLILTVFLFGSYDAAAQRRPRDPSRDMGGVRSPLGSDADSGPVSAEDATHSWATDWALGYTHSPSGDDFAGTVGFTDPGDKWRLYLNASHSAPDGPDDDYQVYAVGVEYSFNDVGSLSSGVFAEVARVTDLSNDAEIGFTFKYGFTETTAGTLNLSYANSDPEDGSSESDAKISLGVAHQFQSGNKVGFSYFAESDFSSDDTFLLWFGWGDFEFSVNDHDAIDAAWSH